MSDKHAGAAASKLPADRHAHILDAAQHCFVRAGFHRTTMQDVAVEAGMSPGNLYRYFPSKDAIVIGLCARDRAQVSADFANLAELGADLDLFESFGRRHLAEEPRGKAILALEIWSEATRNPHLAKALRMFETEIHQHLVGFMHCAQRAGHVPATLDPVPVAQVMTMLVDGFFRRRATDETFDVEAGAAQLFATLRGLMSGAVPVLPSLSLSAA
jgi:TetR/AcrR family transcriptional regulator, repressor for uid operon